MYDARGSSRREGGIAVDTKKGADVSVALLKSHFSSSPSGGTVSPGSGRGCEFGRLLFGQIAQKRLRKTPRSDAISSALMNVRRRTR